MSAFLFKDTMTPFAPLALAAVVVALVLSQRQRRQKAGARPDARNIGGVAPAGAVGDEAYVPAIFLTGLGGYTVPAAARETAAVTVAIENSTNAHVEGRAIGYAIGDVRTLYPAPERRLLRVPRENVTYYVRGGRVIAQNDAAIASWLERLERTKPPPPPPPPPPPAACRPDRACELWQEPARVGVDVPSRLVPRNATIRVLHSSPFLPAAPRFWVIVEAAIDGAPVLGYMRTDALGLSPEGMAGGATPGSPWNLPWQI